MSGRRRKIALIHASPAALEPLARFYRAAAAELETINLLDDGLLCLFEAADWHAAHMRLGEMLAAAQTVYACELAMLTCSAVPREVIAGLRQQAKIPVLKIDESLAKAAVQAGRRIGVVATFAGTLETTRQLLNQAASELDVAIEILPEAVPEAYDALLKGDVEIHDELVAAAVQRLDRQETSAIVLAQVSMARVLDRLRGRTRALLLSSLQTSLDAIRATLEEQ